MIQYSLDNDIAIIAWAMTSAPMNVLNDESIPAFEEALRRAYADDTVRGVIITSNKPEFVVGADLKMILRNSDKDPAAIRRISTELNRIFRSIETSGKPTVAAMNGTALGGGYEICLASHQRIALNNPRTQIGLVEVTLGLLPGGGGTQRLPRMIGLETALSLMLEGKKVGVQEAHRLGLVDDVADSPAELMQKARDWIRAKPAPLKPWDERDRKTGRIVAKNTFDLPGGNVQSATGARLFPMATAQVMAKTSGNYPAPLAILNCVYEGMQVNFDRALAIEARYFVHVATSNVARNLIQTMFLGVNEVNKGLSRPELAHTDVTRVMLLGKSETGEIITQLAARAGIDVVTSGALPPADDPNEFLLLIEAEPDQLTPIDQSIADNVVRLVNPLTVSLSQLAETAPHPERVAGIRFGPDVSPIVEIVRGTQTDSYALAVAFDFVRKLRKTPIIVNEGHYVARCADTYRAEGQALADEGVSATLINNAGKAAGMPTGPLPDPPTPHPAQQPDAQPSLDEVKTRLLYRQAIEALRCLDEGVIGTKLEGNVASVLGWGFPAYTGGALSFVNFVGRPTFVQTLDRLADQYGDRFRLTESLRTRLTSRA